MSSAGTIHSIDICRQTGNNRDVKTIDQIPVADADAQAVLESLRTGVPLDPAIRRRVSERSEQATEALRRRYGTLDVAVDLIREIRDEE